MILIIPKEIRVAILAGEIMNVSIKLEKAAIKFDIFAIFVISSILALYLGMIWFIYQVMGTVFFPVVILVTVVLSIGILYFVHCAFRNLKHIRKLKTMEQVGMLDEASIFHKVN